MGVTQKVGSLGEELTARFLMKRGYKILDRNYRKPWGELDIVAERKGKIHFIEVKALSDHVATAHATPVLKPRRLGLLSGTAHETVTQETSRKEALEYIRSGVKKDRFRAEDHVNTTKMKRLSRIIQTYLIGKRVSDETDWQFDVATVLIDEETKRAKINLIENVIL